MARLAGTAVLAVDYRLAPEHPAPAAVEDLVRAVRWAAGGPEVLGPILPVTGLAGDSAGGLIAYQAARRLAAGVAASRPDVLFMAYPNTDLTPGLPAAKEKGEGWGLSVRNLDWFVRLWLPDASPEKLAEFSPVHGLAGQGSLASMPVTTLLATAEHDPLQPEGARLAERLHAAGTPVDYVSHPGLVHGFLTLDTVSEAARRAGDRLLARYGGRLREAAG